MQYPPSCTGEAIFDTFKNMLYRPFFFACTVIPFWMAYEYCCGIWPSPTVQPTSLKMGVTKADKHCDLGCLFTESPDWEERKKVLGKVLGIKDLQHCVANILPLNLCVCSPSVTCS